MKTIKSFFVLLLLTVSMAATAQTTLKEALKAFIQTNPSASTMSPESMRKALQLMNVSVIKDYNEAKSEQLIESYLKEQFWDDMIDAMLPFVEDKLVLSELNELTAMMSTEKGKSFQEHWGKINGDVSKFEKLGVEIASKVASGEEIVPLQAIDCPDKYKQLFQEFYKLSGQEDLLNSMFDGLGKNFNNEQKTLMENVKNYLSNNMCTMLLNESYGILTEDDIQFGIELGKTQGWQNQMKAVSSMMTNSQELGMSIVMSYVAWLQDQGVETNM